MSETNYFELFENYMDSNNRKLFTNRMCQRARKYLEGGGVAPHTLKDWITVDIGYYGGKKIFDEEEVETLANECVQYAIDGFLLPE